MQKTWRLILDTKHSGYYNMAVDEAILQHYPAQRVPTLRIYGWNEPFVSLGCNQNFQVVLNDSQEVPFVRRMTGGAAILHDKEITYSIVCSLSDLDLLKGVKLSYKALCAFLKYFYKQLGLKAEFAIDSSAGRGEQYKNFCFTALENFDLLINRKKIGGNAQRRRRNIILQHGSIPQSLDFRKIKKTIREPGDIEGKTTSLDICLNRESDFFQLRELLAESFRECFNINFKVQGLCEEEERARRYLVKTKYVQKKWNEKTCLVK